MPFYHRQGDVPRKRHTVFRRPDGALYREEVMGTRGFSGIQSILYHIHPPTSLASSRDLGAIPREADPEPALRMRHFRLAEVSPAPSATLDRALLLFNSDVALSVARPAAADPFHFRNAQADEVVYVARGEGTLESSMGELPYREGDYVVVPRGITHRFQVAGQSLFLVIETAGQIRPPARYRNEHGQLLEHSPYCERDIRVPQRLAAIDERGEFPIVVKRDGRLTEIVLDHHPFDVVGWDGYYFPWALSIHDFEPITGSLHQPPPVHQTFECDGLVICSFVPRLFDYHPDAIPAPYNHSNVMSDEVLFYANDEFMSRTGVGFGSLTLHPGGLTHGPQPGRAEASIGKSRTDELAVMLDTFRPLSVSRSALAWEDAGYARSWLGGDA